MKILFTIPSLRQGGSERVVSLLANNLAANHDITIALQEKGKPIFYDLDSQVRVVEMTPSSSLRYIIMLRKFIKSHSPDVVVSFLMKQNIQALIASIGLKQPVIISERTSKEFYNFFPYNLLSRLGFFTYIIADKLVVQTDQIKSQFWFMLNKTYVVPNPITPPPTTIIKRTDKKKVIAVGRLEKEKRHDLLIQSFKKLNRSFPDWTLEIWGEGPQHCNLQTLITNLNLTSQVKLCGSTNAIYEKLSQSAIYVMPSQAEGFPNALCEAMSIGLPVIYTDISGAKELVKHGETGLLVKADDLDDLTNTLASLMKESTLRRSLGDNAYSFMRGRFTMEEITLQWEQILFTSMRQKFDHF